VPSQVRYTTCCGSPCAVDETRALPWLDPGLTHSPQTVGSTAMPTHLSHRARLYGVAAAAALLAYLASIGLFADSLNLREILVVAAVLLLVIVLLAVRQRHGRP